MKRLIRLVLGVTALALAAATMDWALCRYVGDKSVQGMALRTQATSRSNSPKKPRELFSQVFAEERLRVWRSSAVRGFLALRPNMWYAATEGVPSARAGDIRAGRTRWNAADSDSPGARAVVGSPVHETHLGLIFTPRGPDGVTATDDQTLLPVWVKCDAPATEVAIAGKLLLILDEHSIRGLDALTGEVRWAFITKTVITSGMSITPDGSIVAIAVADQINSTLIALNTANGAVKWARLLPFGTPGMPTIGAGRVIVSGYVAGPWATVVTATDLASGKSSWESRFAEEEVGPAPPGLTNRERDRLIAAVVDENTVYQPIIDRLLALDIRTGARRWLWRRVSLDPVGAFRRGEPRNRISSPLLEPGHAIVATTNGAVAIETDRGQEFWRFEVGSEMLVYASHVESAILQTPVRMGDLLFIVIGNAIAAVRVPDAAPTVVMPALPLTAQPIATAALWGGGGFIIAAALFAVLLHRLRMTVSLISLILLAGVVYLWLDSYQAKRFLGAKEWASAQSITAERRRGIHSEQGRMIFGYSSTLWRDFFRPPIQGDPEHLLWLTRSGLDDQTIQATATRLGLLNSSRPSGSDLGPQSIRALVIPHWPLAALFALAPLAWLTGSWRERKRHPKGHCSACGYDLRASEVGCPECGHGR